jgi:hypothetical protein
MSKPTILPYQSAQNPMKSPFFFVKSPFFRWFLGTALGCLVILGLFLAPQAPFMMEVAERTDAAPWWKLT